MKEGCKYDVDCYNLDSFDCLYCKQEENERRL